MKHLTIQLRIAALFIISAAFSYVPEQYRALFGDWHCGGGYYLYKARMWAGCSYADNDHMATWHWGYRHWLWMLMSLCLFAYNVYLIINKLNSKGGSANEGRL